MAKEVQVTNNNTVGGVGVFTGATIILLVLRAFNLIQITWLQCLIPMAVGLAVGLSRNSCIHNANRSSDYNFSQ